MRAANRVVVSALQLVYSGARLLGACVAHTSTGLLRHVHEAGMQASLFCKAACKGLCLIKYRCACDLLRLADHIW